MNPLIYELFLRTKTNHKVFINSDEKLSATKVCNFPEGMTFGKRIEYGTIVKHELPAVTDRKKCIKCGQMMYDYNYTCHYRHTTDVFMQCPICHYYLNNTYPEELLYIGISIPERIMLLEEKAEWKELYMECLVGIIPVKITGVTLYFIGKTYVGINHEHARDICNYDIPKDRILVLVQELIINY
jgi:hypothetical protein